MTFIQDSYRIEDPKDVTIASLKKLVAALNVQLDQVRDRLATLEGSRPSELNAGGFEVVGLKSGLARQTSAVSRKDLQDRSLYRGTIDADLQTTDRIVSARGIRRTTIAQNRDEVPTLGQLQDQEQRTGVVVRLTDDVGLTSTSFVDITGLSFEAASNVDYAVEATLLYTTGGTTHGINIGLNGPASPASMSFIWTTSPDATVELSRSFSIYDNSTPAATSRPGDNVARLKGTFRCGATGGTVTLRGAVDGLAHSVTVLAGSTLRYARTN